MNVHLFFSQPLAGLTNRPLVRDSDPGTPLNHGQIILREVPGEAQVHSFIIIGHVVRRSEHGCHLRIWRHDMMKWRVGLLGYT